MIHRPATVLAALATSALLGCAMSGCRTGEGDRESRREGDREPRREGAAARDRPAPAQAKPPLPPWRAPVQAPQAPHASDDSDAAAQPCTRGQDGFVSIERDGHRIRRVAYADLLAGPGSVASGRADGRRALPLSALIADAPAITQIALAPCRGAPATVDAAAVRAAPERYVLVANKRGALKLDDTQPPPSSPRRVTSFITVIELRADRTR